MGALRMKVEGSAGMAEGGGGPVWERRRGGGGGNPIVSFLVTLLALFGALVIGLAIFERSVAGAGERVDGWIDTVVGMVSGGADDAENEAADAAGEVVDAAGDAAAGAGEAVEAAADEAAGALKSE